MKKFFIKIGIFVLVVLIFIAATLWFPNPHVKENSLLGALYDKHNALICTQAPRLIFIGGSNISFGLDSRKISDSLKMPVIDMGLTLNLGLLYIVNDFKQYIKKGDYIVLIPEYEFFYTDYFYGKNDLLALLFDVYPEGKENIDMGQWLHLIPLVPDYSKEKIKSVFKIILHKGGKASNDVYSRNSFNRFGDACLHWNRTSETVYPEPACTGYEKIDKNVIAFLSNFYVLTQKKGAKLFILPPVYQNSSFKNRKFIIHKIEDALKEKKLPIVEKPERYRFPDHYFFNSVYHLNKPGVDLRTQIIIKDLKQLILENN